MAHVRLATLANKEKWNSVAEICNNGTIFHIWEWCEMVEQGFGDRCCRVLTGKNAWMNSLTLSD